MSAYGDFHDACIVSLNFQSGAFVDDKSAMHFGGPEERVLSVVFQRQWEPKTIELQFIGLRQLHLIGWQDNYLCNILNSVYTRSGQNSTPNSNATNLHSSQKRCCSFCISSSNASPTFQVQKSIFHQMTKPIQVTVILPLLLAISLSWNDDIHSSISGISNDLIGVIPTIGQ